MKIVKGWDEPGRFPRKYTGVLVISSAYEMTKYALVVSIPGNYIW